MDISDFQPFRSDSNFYTALYDEFSKSTQVLKVNVVTSLKNVYNGLLRSTNKKVSPEKLGKRSCSPSPKSLKRIKLNSFNSEESNSEVSDAEFSNKKALTVDEKKTSQHDDSVVNFKNQKSSIEDLNCHQTSFVIPVLGSSSRSSDSQQLSGNEINVFNDSSEGENYLCSKRKTSPVILSNDDNLSDDSNSCYESAVSHLNDNKSSTFLQSFHDCTDVSAELCGKNDYLCAETPLSKIKLSSIDGKFQDDSDSVLETAASDFKLDLELFSVSDTSGQSTNSLDNNSSSTNKVYHTTWLVKKYCDQLNRSPEQESCESFSMVNGQKLKAGCSHINLDNSSRLDFSEDHTSEMKSCSERCDMTLEKSDNPCVTLEVNNLESFESRNHSESPEKTQNILENSSDKNCSKIQEKTQCILKDYNCTVFQVEHMKLTENGENALLFSKKNLNCELKEELAISPLRSDFPACNGWGNGGFSQCIQTQSGNLFKKPDSISKNHDEKVAGICLLSVRQTGIDPKTDEKFYTLPNTCELEDNTVDKSPPKNFLYLDSGNDSFPFHLEKIQEQREKPKTSLVPTHSTSSTILLEREVKGQEVEAQESFSNRLSDCVVNFVPSKTKNDLTEDINLEPSSEIQNNRCQVSEKKLKMCLTILEKSQRDTVANKCFKISEDIEALKSNFKEIGEFSLEKSKMKLTEDNICFVKDDSGKENHIKENMKLFPKMNPKSDMVLFHDSSLYSAREKLDSSEDYNGEGGNLIASIKTHFQKSVKPTLENVNSSERIMNGPLSNSPKLMHPVDDSIPENNNPSLERSKEKPKVINYLDVENTEPKSKRLCKLSPKLHSIDVNLSCFSDSKRDITSASENTNLRNRQKILKTLQKSEEISERWRVKTTDVNSFYDKDCNVVPPLILQRSPRALVHNAKHHQALSESCVAHSKNSNQSNQDRKNNGKTLLSPPSTRMVNERLYHKNSSFSSPPKDNVKRVFDVLSPINRSVPFFIQRQSGRFPKSISEDVNFAIQTISKWSKGNQSKPRISNAREFAINSKATLKQPVGSLDEESCFENFKARLETSKSVIHSISSLTKDNQSDFSKTSEFYTKSKGPVSCLVEEYGFKAGLKTGNFNMQSNLLLSNDFYSKISDKIDFDTKSKEAFCCYEVESPTDEFKSKLEKENSTMQSISHLVNQSESKIPDTNEFGIKSEQSNVCLEDSCIGELKAGFRIENPAIQSISLLVNSNLSESKNSDATVSCSKLNQPVDCFEEKSRSKPELELENIAVQSIPQLLNINHSEFEISTTTELSSKSNAGSCIKESEVGLKTELENSEESRVTPRRAKTKALLLLKEILSKRTRRKRVQ